MIRLNYPYGTKIIKIYYLIKIPTLIREYRNKLFRSDVLQWSDSKSHSKKELTDK